ncbi:hypothetical protein J6590_101468 [Homalodisca vitripennis]|nr:hypothetical protein J6590_101468 [Homalodisca vitripennis]
MLASLGDNTGRHTNLRMIKINKKKPSRSPVNEATVRRLLEQAESEDEMSSAIDDTDSDPDYGPSSFRDQPHTPD